MIRQQLSRSQSNKLLNEGNLQSDFPISICVSTHCVRMMFSGIAEEGCIFRIENNVRGYLLHHSLCLRIA